MLYGAIIGGVIGLVVYLLIMKTRSGKKRRTSHVVLFSGDVYQKLMQLDSFLQSKNYFPISYSNEMGVYQKGGSVVTYANNIKICPHEGGILVEGFVGYAGAESSLGGFINMVGKKSCKKVVNELIKLIQNG